MVVGPHDPPVPVPDPSRVIRIEGLTKRFGSLVAVEDLSFSVFPGRVTGFLGPNGAGKTTTLRMLLGLVRPTRGRATIGGLAYSDLPQPQRTVGAALEASDFHPGRTARDHLRVLAAPMGVPRDRVAEMLDLVGLTEPADRRVGGFSLGMRQRLSLASALLGNPGVLVLDEPANGLDPEGIAWLRSFLRHLADQGRTVLVSSHVLSEVQQTVDDVVIISRGRLVRASTLQELSSSDLVQVATPQPDTLLRALVEAGLPARPVGPDTLEVRGTTPARVGRIAFTAGVELHRLEAAGEDLERTFLRLVAGNGLPDPVPGQEPVPPPAQAPAQAPDEAPAPAPAPDEDRTPTDEEATR
jgi:ABC-2 type transport system ATP-binding protein